MSKPVLVDIGANLTHDSFAPDRDAVIARAAAAGVARQIVTGADLEGSRRAALIASAHPDLLSSTAGVHPHHAAQTGVPEIEERLVELLSQPQVVAVGECGLDYYRNYSPREAQLRVFCAQLEIAVRLQLPVFLHQRAAHEDFLAVLREFAPRLAGGVAHCFTGSEPEAEQYLALGLHVGITGWICDERRGAHLPAVVARIPAQRLLLETDAPYLLPRDLRPPPKSRRNEPMYLVHIARRVAAARGEGLETLAASTTANALRLFGLQIGERVRAAAQL